VTTRLPCVKQKHDSKLLITLTHLEMFIAHHVLLVQNHLKHY